MTLDMHYLVNQLHDFGHPMHDDATNGFLPRHTEGEGGAYVEDFLINQRRPPLSDRNVLHCFAYGESLWRSYRQNGLLGGAHWSFEQVTGGDGVFASGKVQYKLLPGDVYILRPGRRFSVRPGPGGLLRKRCALFEGQLLDYICGSGRLAGVEFIRPAERRRLDDVYAEVKRLILDPAPLPPDALGVQAYTLLAELNRLAAPSQYPAPLRRALNLIDAGPHRGFSLSPLALECGASVSTLSRLFRRHLGVSPMEYIIDRRLEQAKLLLGMGNMPLKEVAERCGYHSESFLSRSFKKKFGVPPSKIVASG